MTVYVKCQCITQDLGCGIGGPAREISRFTEAKIVGLNNNAYQVKRAEELTKKAGMQDSCSFVKVKISQQQHKSVAISYIVLRKISVQKYHRMMDLI